MLTKLSTKGQIVLPKAIREMARIEAGNELEIDYSGGMIVLRKPEALDTVRVRQLLKEGRKLPAMTTDDEAAVADAIGRIRRRASRK
jgi:AbrB family looped-hinge helix DNA binding protein